MSAVVTAGSAQVRPHDAQRVGASVGLGETLAAPSKCSANPVPIAALPPFAIAGPDSFTQQRTPPTRALCKTLPLLAVLLAVRMVSAEVLVSTQAGDAAYENFYQQPTSYTVTTARWGIYRQTCYLCGIISEPNFGFYWVYSAGPGNYESGRVATLDEGISGALAASGRMAVLMMTNSGVDKVAPSLAHARGISPAG